ncbi:unnamed protein product [Staurois parvus]|uniref:Uncharacterized protein n=1 Tax=Staurois parvus TaxID=386267 RepID=A0ABN9FZ56_9NEOB|nr:unnamed protein product [Staurois parvus]
MGSALSILTKPFRSGMDSERSLGRFAHVLAKFYGTLDGCRGGLTIWKLGHCPRARGQ